MLIKGLPCRIVDMSTHKTGKHGHAKINFTALDIFTNRKVQAMETSTTNCVEVIVERSSYMVTDVDHDEGVVNCLDEDNETVAFPIPPDEDVAKAVEDALAAMDSGEESRDLYVAVLKAIGHEQIIATEWKK